MNSPTVIVGIHGLNNKPPKDTLDDFWRLSITEGLERHRGLTEIEFDFVSAYWADLMRSPSLRGSDGRPADGDVNEEPYVRGTDNDGRSKAGTIFDEIRAVVGEGVEETGRRLLKEVKSNFGFGFDVAQFGIHRLMGKLLEVLFEDLSRYYDDETLRSAVQERLESVLRDVRDREIMLIAHSMGSIIAYDVLTKLDGDDPDFKVDQFVTIGSPLGLRFVKQKGKRKSGEMPTPKTPDCVRNWVNMGDRHDPVSLDIELANDYAPNGDGVSCRDLIVKNDYEVLKDGEDEPDSNPHKSYGYLRTRQLSELAKAFVRQ